MKRSSEILLAMLLLFAGVAADAASAAPLVERVRDIRPGPGNADPSELTGYQGKLYFSADDGTSVGEELWVSDGTEGGTQLFKDIRSVGEGEDSGPRDLTPFGGRLFFAAAGGITGTELWSTDGTAVGTESHFGGAAIWEPIPLGSRLLFPGYLSGLGTEPYSWDGSSAALIEEIAPGFGDGWFGDPAVLDGKVYFRGDDGGGQELWKSDGTAAGTEPAGDINPSGGSQPYEARTVDGRVYFSADDGTHGHELWAADDSGVELVEDIKVAGDSDSWPYDFVGLGGKVYFVAAGPIADGAELWVHDPGTGTTEKVKNIAAGSDGSEPEGLTVYDGRLYFAADDHEGHGGELWVSDGTEAGTQLLKDIQPGPEGSQPERFTVFEGRLYFSAYEEEHGTELWATDGTAAGTELVADLEPGSGDGAPRSLTPFGGRLYFSADDLDSGRELWSLRNPPPPSESGPPVETTPPAPEPEPEPIVERAPTLTKLKLTHKRFKPKVGTSFKFDLSEQAKVTLKIEAKLRPDRFRKRKTLSRSGHPGHNSIKYSGGGLAAGPYRATLYATDPTGRRSRAARVSFTLVR